MANFSKMDINPKTNLSLTSTGIRHDGGLPACQRSFIDRCKSKNNFAAKAKQEVTINVI
jgi:hypothetical protein